MYICALRSMDWVRPLPGLEGSRLLQTEKAHPVTCQVTATVWRYRLDAAQMGARSRFLTHPAEFCYLISIESNFLYQSCTKFIILHYDFFTSLRDKFVIIICAGQLKWIWKNNTIDSIAYDRNSINYRAVKVIIELNYLWFKEIRWWFFLQNLRF